MEGSLFNNWMIYHMIKHCLQACDWLESYFFSTIVGLRTILS